MPKVYHHAFNCISLVHKTGCSCPSLFNLGGWDPQAALKVDLLLAIRCFCSRWCCFPSNGVIMHFYFCGVCIQQLVPESTFRTISALCCPQAVCPREARGELWKCTLTLSLCISVGEESQSNLDDPALFCFMRLGWNPGPLHARQASYPLAAPTSQTPL